ncbi:g8201 [Coccomyxa elongata]
MAEPFTYGNDLVFKSASSKRQKLGEDFVFDSGSGQAGVRVLGVCDGHYGKGAAAYVSSHFLSELQDRLLINSHADRETTAAELRHAITRTFIKLAECFERSKKISGTTLTVAILIKDLLTVANIGDCKAFLDDGVELVELTNSHRIEDNIGEQRRLQSAGALVGRSCAALTGPTAEGEKGIGKLRVWAKSGLGGLRIGRAIGSAEIGRCIVPHPHIRQVVVPRTGARLILGSDGLWDPLDTSKVFSLCQQLPPQAAAARLSSVAYRAQGSEMKDDVAVIVADILPASSTQDWPAVRASLVKGPKSWLPACFARPAVKDGGLDTCEALEVVADVDTWAEYAARCAASARKALTRDDSAMQDLDKQHTKVQQAAALPANQAASRSQTC